MQTVTLNLFEQLMAQASEAISHYPQIGDNGNWFVWDVDSGAFVDTGETALGDPTQWYTGTSITGVEAQPLQRFHRLALLWRDLGTCISTKQRRTYTAAHWLEMPQRRYGRIGQTSRARRVLML